MARAYWCEVQNSLDFFFFCETNLSEYPNKLCCDTNMLILRESE